MIRANFSLEKCKYFFFTLKFFFWNQLGNFIDLDPDPDSSNLSESWLIVFGSTSLLFSLLFGVAGFGLKKNQIRTDYTEVDPFLGDILPLVSA